MDLQEIDHLVTNFAIGLCVDLFGSIASEDPPGREWGINGADGYLLVGIQIGPHIGCHCPFRYGDRCALFPVVSDYE